MDFVRKVQIAFYILVTCSSIQACEQTWPLWFAKGSDYNITKQELDYIESTVVSSSFEVKKLHDCTITLSKNLKGQARYDITGLPTSHDFCLFITIPKEHIQSGESLFRLVTNADDLYDMIGILRSSTRSLHQSRLIVIKNPDNYISLQSFSAFGKAKNIFIKKLHLDEPPLSPLSLNPQSLFPQ